MYEYKGNIHAAFAKLRELDVICWDLTWFDAATIVGQIALINEYVYVSSRMQTHSDMQGIVMPCLIGIGKSPSQDEREALEASGLIILPEVKHPSQLRALPAFDGEEDWQAELQETNASPSEERDYVGNNEAAGYQEVLKFLNSVQTGDEKQAEDWTRQD